MAPVSIIQNSTQTLLLHLRNGVRLGRKINDEEAEEEHRRGRVRVWVTQTLHGVRGRVQSALGLDGGEEEGEQEG